MRHDVVAQEHERNEIVLGMSDEREQDGSEQPEISNASRTRWARNSDASPNRAEASQTKTSQG